MCVVQEIKADRSGPGIAMVTQAFTCQSVEVFTEPVLLAKFTKILCCLPCKGILPVLKQHLYHLVCAWCPDGP